MKEKLFSFNDLEIWREEELYFAIYDAGAQQVEMRRDEITKEEAELALTGESGATEMLFALQKRLIAAGIDPYVST